MDKAESEMEEEGEEEEEEEKEEEEEAILRLIAKAESENSEEEKLATPRGPRVAVPAPTLHAFAWACVVYCLFKVWRSMLAAFSST
jgi:hypothetical protein